MAAYLQATADLDSDSDDKFEEICILLGCTLVRDDRCCIPDYYEPAVGKYYKHEFKRLFWLLQEHMTRFQTSTFFPAICGRK